VGVPERVITKSPVLGNFPFRHSEDSANQMDETD
jgi:hypothetical protein